jgi:hypothetical protein
MLREREAGFYRQAQFGPRILFLSLLAVFVATSTSSAEDQALTYAALVDRLTDLTRLATIPGDGEQCAQWSSYDRKSRYDASADKYIGWDANGDGNGIIRKEGDKLVLGEMEGPGCIWRIWSATPGDGHVRIYLDGATEPAIDLPFKQYFDGKTAPFTRPALVHTVALGWNNYTPIPYQRSCKVVADPGWGLYYHFTYGTFPKRIRVPTFKRELDQDDLAALDRANEVLTRCSVDTLPHASNEKRVVRTVNVSAGKPLTVAKFGGSGAITRIRMKMNLPASPADRDVLREMAIQIKWDGESTPSVWAPLGDFFGTAPGLNKYRSLPLGCGEDGWWYCNWYMPFETGALVQLLNQGKSKRLVDIEIMRAPLSLPVQRLARFHAKWHRDAFLPQIPERSIDWPLLKTEGKGRFVGMMLHIWNPRGGWWGEGDEKFFVDGEKFPSTFGTGSEDYFGYAWSRPDLFQHALHNQTHNDGNSRGHISVNRWHVVDNVPFQHSFEGDIEKYFPNQRPTLYAAMAYWYLAPGGEDPYQSVPVEQRVGYWTPVETYKVKGVLEGERLKVLAKTGGHPQEQDLSGFQGQWSNDAHLWWIEAKPGDKLDLAVPVNSDGKYKLSLQLTKAPDYGIAQLYLDGAKLGAPIDLYHGSVIPSGELQMGEFQLGSGQHKLSVEILGANDKAIKNYMFGLDYVKLERAD